MYKVPGNLHAFLSSAEFFKINFFEKILSGLPSECQTDWIEIRPDALSGLIWVQSVCKGFEQTTLVGNALSRDYSEIVSRLLKAGAAVNQQTVVSVQGSWEFACFFVVC